MSDTSKLYKGSLEALILQLIGQNKELYGYELTQLAKEKSKENLVIAESTLYPLLHRLELEGQLESEIRPFKNRMRKYYRLTPQGMKKQKEAAYQLNEFMLQLASFLNLKLA